MHVLLQLVTSTINVAAASLQWKCHSLCFSKYVSALPWGRCISLPFYLTKKKKSAKQKKKMPTKQKSKWDFLDCWVLETICGHRWVSLMFLKGEGSSKGGSELNGMKNKWPNLEMRPKCGCGGLVLFFSLVTFNDKRLLILKIFPFFWKIIICLEIFVVLFKRCFSKLKFFGHLWNICFHPSIHINF